MEVKWLRDWELNISQVEMTLEMVKTLEGQILGWEVRV